MTKNLEIYKCSVCGNIVETVHTGDGQLACCNQPMNLMTENTVEASREKHIPVLARSERGLNVKVGSVVHPMEEKHYIEWIEVITPSGRACRQFLKPGQAPEATFKTEEADVTVREYCNLHGLWKA